MHPRHRSPGNGYRSGSMGMGMGASRISPETSTRGHGFYNSEYRSFNNRGFGRAQSQPKTFQQPSQPPQRKGDILMEAGRLAVEYLVSKGMLPQTALSGKWQNGSLKKQFGDYQDFRQLEENAQDGRTSVHARLGTNAPDAGSGRRRYTDDFNTRNHLKGRRRNDYQRSYSSEWGRENGRSGSWADKNRVSSDVEGEDDTVSGHTEEQEVSKGVEDELQNSGPIGLTPENQENVELRTQKYSHPDEMGSKASASDAGKDVTDGESLKGSDNLSNLNPGNAESKSTKNNGETEKPNVQDIPIQNSATEADLSCKNGSDLLTLCKFAKVPTKTRSALTYRASMLGQVPKIEEANAPDIVPPKGPEVIVQDGVSGSTAEVLANATQDPEFPNSETSKEVSFQSVDNGGELGLSYVTGQGKGMRSHSFSDRGFVHDSEPESSERMPSFGRSTSVKERGEKRPAEDDNMDEVTKRAREWLQPLVSTTDDYSHIAHLTNLVENRASSRQERASPDKQVVGPITEENLVKECHLPENSGEPTVAYAQEKQLFPSSFKICDLNLMEASDINDNHRSDPACMYPSIMTTEKEASQLAVDLSMSNSNLSGEYSRHASNRKEIEVIDLENDSIPEEKAFDDSRKKEETEFTGTEGFHSHAQNAADITDVHDNYDGLMISEFLNAFPNCTAVAEDMNPLQNEISLHNGEGTLGDDDSIYMSLEEIPLSFIPDWEQPTPQEYEKPF